MAQPIQGSRRAGQTVAHDAGQIGVVDPAYLAAQHGFVADNTNKIGTLDLNAQLADKPEKGLVHKAETWGFMPLNAELGMSALGGVAGGAGWLAKKVGLSSSSERLGGWRTNMQKANAYLRTTSVADVANDLGGKVRGAGERFLPESAVKAIGNGKQSASRAIGTAFAKLPEVSLGSTTGNAASRAAERWAKNHAKEAAKAVTNLSSALEAAKGHAGLPEGAVKSLSVIEQHLPILESEAGKSLSEINAPLVQETLRKVQRAVLDVERLKPGKDASALTKEAFEKLANLAGGFNGSMRGGGVERMVGRAASSAAFVQGAANPLKAAVQAPGKLMQQTVGNAGLKVGLAAQSIGGFALTLHGAKAHVTALCKLCGDLQGDGKPVSISHALFSSDVPQVVADARHNLFKQFGTGLLADTGMAAVNVAMMRAGTGFAAMLPAIAIGGAQAMLLPKYQFLPAYDAIQKAESQHQQVPVAAYATLLCASASKIAAVGTDNRLVAAIAGEYAQKQTPVAEVMKDLSNGKIDQRAAALQKQLTEQAHQAAAKPVAHAAPAKAAAVHPAATQAATAQASAANAASPSPKIGNVSEHVGRVANSPGRAMTARAG